MLKPWVKMGKIPGLFHIIPSLDHVETLNFFQSALVESQKWALTCF